MKAGIDYIGVSVTFICHDGKGNFLMHKRSKNVRDEQERWEFGGGKLEFGEKVLDGLKREVGEEYGCDLFIDESLPPTELHREHNGTKTHWITFPHIVRVNPEEAKINEPESMDEIGWFTLDTLPSPLHSGIPLFIEHYQDYFTKYGKPS